MNYQAGIGTAAGLSLLVAAAFLVLRWRALVQIFFTWENPFRKLLPASGFVMSLVTVSAPVFLIAYTLVNGAENIQQVGLRHVFEREFASGLLAPGAHAQRGHEPTRRPRPRLYPAASDARPRSGLSRPTHARVGHRKDADPCRACGQRA
jgi:hypothetical protein